MKAHHLNSRSVLFQLYVIGGLFFSPAFILLECTSRYIVIYFLNGDRVIGFICFPHRLLQFFQQRISKTILLFLKIVFGFFEFFLGI